MAIGSGKKLHGQAYTEFTKNGVEAHAEINLDSTKLP
jgi:hypothetical protein